MLEHINWENVLMFRAEQANMIVAGTKKSLLSYNSSILLWDSLIGCG